MSTNTHGNVPPAQQMNHQDPEHDPNEEEEEEGDENANRFLFFNVMPSWMVSFITHVGLIILLALLVLPREQKPVVGLEAGDSANDAIEDVDTEFDDDTEIETEDVLEEVDPAELAEEVEETVEEPETIAVEEFQDFGQVFADTESNFDEAAFNPVAFQGSEVDSRGEASRAQLLRAGGGNSGSEKAVENALAWIARHQLPDGGWSLDHTEGPGKDRDQNNPGTHDAARAGATALALLPFLGHGDTHLAGDYQETVRNGLNFLMKRGVADGRGISWHEPKGTMYSHGLVAIAFNEAYAMTGDSQLAPFAQGSIWFIEDVQDPRGGGWRYSKKQAGDTSAVGWQVMAIKSAKLSGLDYQKKTIKLTEKFLDSVSISYGACYGYTDPPTRNGDGSFPSRRAGCTSVGLLCRMYMGWDREHQGLSEGVAWLTKMGPSVGSKQRPQAVNMYYNYYATQVLKHYGGQEWKKWNGVMRDFLVESQETEGTKKGSWHWGSKNHAAESGGRLYQTAMATMTLEVYYRFLPLYKDAAAEDDFPLDD